MHSSRHAADPGVKQRLISRAPRTRSVIAATALLVVCVAPFANARTGDNLREGVRNGTTTAETQIVSNINATTRTTGGYSTRQSNLSSSGGGAIYGCRSAAGGSAANPPQNPCVRANNLSTGFAFEFHATRGDIAGLITAGAGGDSKRPFITNATGVAVGLNADRLDGLHASEILTAAAADATAKANAAKSRWFLVNAAGQIEAQSGGFTITTCYPADPAAANGNCYVDTGADLTNKGINATIALQNTTDQNGDGITNGTAPGADANPEFSGEISASRCFTPGEGAIVNCAPTGTNNPNHVVISPRNSDGTATTDGTRKRFYVTIAG
ncbi:MAG: hypothetical protein Q8O56_00780 [Solirubrobacteraceae bacterium]|nr:hypothetical protein [Solirubrobacteraceae bacterium]